MRAWRLISKVKIAHVSIMTALLAPVGLWADANVATLAVAATGGAGIVLVALSAFSRKVDLRE